ncbi:unnamed protein product [Darwinula stevensoni]|uniref:CMP-sialic acid transporter n=1 Tax=Darwinula stevensoni TaxID=69355 RepID=A0A7R8XBZ8_9CRUS|nr:unnamed protein product [Darwinula stevensoni]CAG0892882.1 unnamed protein product [Darwinula stevensoni]
MKKKVTLLEEGIQSPGATEPEASLAWCDVFKTSCSGIFSRELFPTCSSFITFVSYMALSINQGLMVKGSQDDKNKYSYSTIAAVLMTEILKLLTSFIIYFYKDIVRIFMLRQEIENLFFSAVVMFGHCGMTSAKAAEVSQNLKSHVKCVSANDLSSISLAVLFSVLLLYFVPAFLYCLYNNLAFTNLGKFDPTTYFLLLQLRVVVTGVCFQVLFKKTLTFRQWISLLILTLGCIVKNVGVTRAQNAATDSSSSLAETILADIIVAIFSVNIIYILLQVFSSCFAGVFNEYLLKDYGAKTPLMVQNLYMYFNSIICNLFLVYLDQTVIQIQDSSLNWKNLFNPKVLLIIANNAAIGIVTSFFLHQLNSILKAFASALELVFTAVLTWIIFGIPIDGYTITALVIVIYASLLYSQSPVVNVARTGSSRISK